MRSRFRLIFISLFMISFSFVGFINNIYGYITIPNKPPNYVVDLANIIQEDWEMKLNNYLKELEQKTTTQMVILTIDSLEGGSIEDFSITTAERWKLGEKGKDNGVLIVVALKERRYRLEIGYGLEGILPDSLVGNIGRKYMVPYFRQGDYSKGILTTTLAIITKIAEERGIKISGIPTVKSPPIKGNINIFTTLSYLLIIIIFLSLFIRHPNLLLSYILLSSIGGRSSRGWGGIGSNFGGGRFGGSFGGFGGGGGGSFGGGGASGGW